MRNRLVLAAALAASIHPAAAAPNVDIGPAPGGVEVVPRPFFQRQPDGTDRMPGLPGLDGPPRAGPSAGGVDRVPGDPVPAAGAATEPPPKPPTRAEALDRLLNRLAKAKDAGEAQGIARLVERVWMESGSATADLLMARAVTAMNGNRHDVAAALLDKILALRPGWAEAWNKRATLRFLDGDDMGSMADISHVLALEPRHFGALGGMGFILERHGQDAAALTAIRRALAVYPEDADLRKAADKLAPAVEGQDL